MKVKDNYTLRHKVLELFYLVKKHYAVSEENRMKQYFLSNKICFSIVLAK